DQAGDLPQNSFAWAVSPEGISMWTIVPFTPSPFLCPYVVIEATGGGLGSDGLDHVRQHRVERPWDLRRVQRVDEPARVPNLPASAAAHEPPQLLLDGASLPRRLLLKRAKRSQIALGLDHLFHGRRSMGADQLVFEVFDADEEADPPHAAPREVRAEPGPFEPAHELALFGGVTEPRELQALRNEHVEAAADRLGAAHRHERNPGGIEVDASMVGQRLDRDQVAGPLDEDRCAGVRAQASAA